MFLVLFKNGVISWIGLLIVIPAGVAFFFPVFWLAKHFFLPVLEPAELHSFTILKI